MTNRELELYYQPKIDLRSGCVAGVEALLRWPTQAGFTAGCGKLIEVLEETGGIVEVGRWAIQRAIDDRMRWRDAGLLPPPVPPRVAANQPSF